MRSHSRKSSLLRHTFNRLTGPTNTLPSPPATNPPPLSSYDANYPLKTHSSQPLSPPLERSNTALHFMIIQQKQYHIPPQDASMYFLILAGAYVVIQAYPMADFQLCSLTNPWVSFSRCSTLRDPSSLPRLTCSILDHCIYPDVLLPYHGLQRVKDARNGWSLCCRLLKAKS